MTDSTDWRQQAEDSDRHEWCEECGKSYFAHFGSCPHTSHSATSQ